MLSGNGVACGSPATATPRLELLLDGALLLTRGVLLPAMLLLTGAVLDDATVVAAVLTLLTIPLTDGVPATLAQAVSAATTTTPPAKLTAVLRRPPRDPAPPEYPLRKPTRSPMTQQPLFFERSSPGRSPCSMLVIRQSCRVGSLAGRTCC
jgi:hypothetical protein